MRNCDVWETVCAFLPDGCYLQGSLTKFTNKCLKKRNYPTKTEVNATNLKWAISQGYRMGWSNNAAAMLARANDLETLQWARSRGCGWDGRVCHYFAAAGNLRALKWCRKTRTCHKRRREQCPWNQWTCESAAENGHLEVLKWAIENGCPWDPDYLLEIASERGDLPMVKFVCSTGLIENPGWPMHYGIMTGNLEMVRYIVGLKLLDPLDIASRIRWAAEKGHVDVVRYLVVEWQPCAAVLLHALPYATSNGHLKTARYLIRRVLLEHPGDGTVCASFDEALMYAVGAGHLEIVTLLVDNGANVNFNALLHFANRNGHSAVVEYLIQQGAGQVWDIHGNYVGTRPLA